MTHQLYTAQYLQELKLDEIKKIARRLGITPEGDKRSKDNWVNAIIEHQKAQVIELSGGIRQIEKVADEPQAQEQTDDYLFHDEQPNNLPKVGDSHFIGEFLLRCSQVYGDEYAAVWEVYDENNALMGEIRMDWTCYWTHTLSQAKKFCTPQQATVDLAETYRQQCAMRSERAQTIEVLERHDNEFVVQNQENKNQYVVRPDHPELNLRCECPDCYHRSAKCKHQIAVESYLMRQRLEEIVATAPSPTILPGRTDVVLYSYSKHDFVSYMVGSETREASIKEKIDHQFYLMDNNDVVGEFQIICALA